jgi:hypothetical protein
MWIALHAVSHFQPWLVCNSTNSCPFLDHFLKTKKNESWKKLSRISERVHKQKMPSKIHGHFSRASACCSKTWRGAPPLEREMLWEQAAKRAIPSASQNAVGGRRHLVHGVNGRGRRSKVGSWLYDSLLLLLLIPISFFPLDSSTLLRLPT